MPRDLKGGCENLSSESADPTNSSDAPGSSLRMKRRVQPHRQASSMRNVPLVAVTTTNAMQTGTLRDGPKLARIGPFARILD